MCLYLFSNLTHVCEEIFFMKSYLELVSGTFDPSPPAFDEMLPAGLFIFLGCAGVLFFSVINFKRII